MFRSTPALAVASVLLLSAACSQSPTAPTALPGAAAVAGAAQTPTHDPAAIQAQPQAIGATRFLAFGDSITAGVQSSFDGMFLFDDLPGSYPSRLLSRFQGAYPAQGFSLFNEGRPGEWASDGERRLRTVLDTRAGPSVPVGNRSQALLVLEGINDMNNGVSATRAAASLAQLVQIGRLYNLTVLVATMPQTYTNTANGSSFTDTDFSSLLRNSTRPLPKPMKPKIADSWCGVNRIAPSPTSTPVNPVLRPNEPDPPTPVGQLVRLPSTLKKLNPGISPALLREVEVLLSQGSTVCEASRKLGVMEQTYYRWRREHGGRGSANCKTLAVQSMGCSAKLTAPAK